MFIVLFALAVLVAAVSWRPHGLGPALGALAAVSIAALAGATHAADLMTALRAQWPAFITLGSVMIMTATAERMGLLERLAAWIEPRTRGPVRHAYFVTFVIAALVAAVFSNDAAILLLTPTVIALLRTVYPKRHPKFLVPFAFAIFAAAGVAPLVVSNPMNLIFAEHMGLSFNRYALTMIPVALASWVASYYCLRWVFRDVLADTSPALGAWPGAPTALSVGAKLVLGAVVAVLVAYPIMSYAGAPLWPVAAAGGLVCAAVSLRAGNSFRSLGDGVAWSIFPFLVGVFILAMALERVGAVDLIRQLYAASDAPIATVGTVSALGSALLNNHPMSVVNALALTGLDDAHHVYTYAALIGGDLGPRLLPMGSLASLLWFEILRKHQVEVRVTTFIKVGVALTAVPLAASLGVLWVLAR